MAKKKLKVDDIRDQMERAWPPGVSEYVIARAAGVGRTNLNDWRNGKRGVSTLTATKILRGIEKVKKAIEEERKSAAGGEDQK